jgi:hypothetical protein
VPPDANTSGTVTFTALVQAKTGAASKNVALTFGHLALADAETIDAAYTDEDADDQPIDATTGNLSVITWTETFANLGWAASDFTYFRVSRFAATTNNLSGDMYLRHFSITIPRS